MEGPPVEVWRLFLATLAWELDESDRQTLGERLALGGTDLTALIASRGRVESALAELAAPALEPHDAAAALAPLSEEEILLVMALGDGSQREWVRRQLTEFRSLRLSIRGADLVARGVPSGPIVGRALAATRDARIDGRIDRAAELGFALEVAAAESGVGEAG
jgi:tRNA nucleotidyltransferase (CCA-adding enzyme)